MPEPNLAPALRPADYARLLTPYALAAALALYAIGPERAPPLVAETVRALAAFVAVAAAYVHARYDCRDVVQRFYERVFPPGTPRAAMVAAETLAHFLPPLLIGPPGDARGVAAGYAIFAAWYAAARGRMRALYMDNVPRADYDRLALVALPLAGAAWCAALAAAGAPRRS